MRILLVTSLDTDFFLHTNITPDVSCSILWETLKAYIRGDRQQFVQMRNHRSRCSAVLLGAPQGWVLSLLLFIIYLIPLGTILWHHGIHFHCYADDTQVYISTKPSTALPPTSLTTCLEDIWSWMRRNFLKLNGSKTDALLIGFKSTLAKIQSTSLTSSLITSL